MLYDCFQRIKTSRKRIFLGCEFYFFGKAFFTLFLFGKKKTCAKRKTMGIFLVKVFTEGKKVADKTFLSKKRFKKGFLTTTSIAV